eukprot:CAMPEP_0185576336 /NCGR_PEP_ID=MMETSP0434-20130131/7288_1 /TAXON_ID=626734 ORGANISM="Favella taraikaensis, Strain Fe Narragansett Bay" /NCGR_SAMPLE_ID=MMETSP0434 /ASSEMBLY_ACC=CAM_ASM_000379 /LENGTH=70 /DNA_ID=CAMNT_0028193497 /DNA_START=565 /DNA_END=777 /DNA_ORIENTATION=+
MNGYNEAMQESDAAYRLDQKKQSNARGMGGALSQMIQGGAQSPCPDLEIQLLKEENEALKRVIEQMKVDM